MKLASASRNFAETTTFHGAHELLLSPNTFMQMIWGIIMLISIFFCAWQLYQTVAEFRGQPTAMRLFTKRLDEYPTVYFTVLNTIDYNKLNQCGLDSRHGQYILDHFPALKVQAEEWKELVSDPKEIENIRADIQRVQADNGWDFADMVRAVANSPESLFSIVEGEANMSITINEYGISYAFKRRMEVAEIDVGYGMGITVQPKAVNPQFNSSRYYMRDYRGVYVSVGTDIHDIGQWYLVKWKTSSLVIDPQMTRSLSTKQRPCSNEYEDALQCSITCRANDEVCGRDCEWFVGQKTNHSQRLCINAIDRTGACKSDCKALCPPSCNIWSYNVEVKIEIGYDTGPINPASVYIFMSSMEVMAAEEYYSYSSSTLFSNLGGILSLYLGASVISFMHLIYFWFFKARMVTVEPERA